MSYKIYLVTHLDKNKKYVGITSKDLHQRWYQHMKDKASALHPDITTESHRMTMELIGEADTKQEALQMESEFIQELGTEVPNGYNRQVRGCNFDEHRKLFVPDLRNSKYRKSENVKGLELFPSGELTGVGSFDAPAPLNHYARFVIKGFQYDINTREKVVECYTHAIVVYNQHHILHHSVLEDVYSHYGRMTYQQVIFCVYVYDGYWFPKTLVPNSKYRVYTSRYQLHEIQKHDVIKLMKEIDGMDEPRIISGYSNRDYLIFDSEYLEYSEWRAEATS